MLFDAHGSPVSVDGLNSSKDQEYSETSDNSGDNEHPLVGGDKPPVKIIVESSEAESKQRKTEYRYSYALQREGVRVQWWLLFATLAAFGAAAYYAWIAKNQLKTMTDTLKEVHIQNVAQQRALLSVPAPPSFQHYGQLLIRIKNSGRLAAKLDILHVTYVQRVRYDLSFPRYRDIPVQKLISADDFYDVELYAPPIPRYQFFKKTNRPAVGEGWWEVSVGVTADYDGGFGDQETFHYCSFLEPITKTWGDNCVSPSPIDLSQVSKDTKEEDVAPYH